ncbi:MAG: DUF4159 domain-containing protein, partial [Planctomycetales bacterium]|nr:DUF4159 domain-containing protein [Planctomycetales bacterium]
MPRKRPLGLLIVMPMLLVVPEARADITAADVNRAIDRGVEFLKTEQDKSRGGWSEYPNQPGGLTSLCTLALLSCGEPVNSPTIQRSLAYLRTLGKPSYVYATSLQTMVFCAAEPEKDRLLILRNVRWLESVQIKQGDRKGSWGYSNSTGNGDNSNTQFALLALHEAEQVGVDVNEQTWRLAEAYWKRTQREDGAWGYYPAQPATGSMTCAGIASLVITSGRLGESAASVSGDSIACCGATSDDDALARALHWLAQKFSVTTNPSPLSASGSALARGNLLYYLYALERVGRMTGRRFIGRHDWYREGANVLVQSQDSLTGRWTEVGHSDSSGTIGTSFALLFLSKGRRNVVISHLRHGESDDWQRHRDGVQQLTRHVERAWKRDLTWQTVDGRVATLEDLLQTPVLFISGGEAFELSAREKDNLRLYIENGGFIFAEANDGNGCDGQAFDRSFRALMAELFNSPLRKLPPDHSVWFAEQPIDPDALPSGLWLYGVEACCRTSVVYCPRSLSCFWELSRGSRDTPYSEHVNRQIEACVKIGVNVLAYATNRQLKDKLDRPRIAADDNAEPLPERGTLQIPKLAHGGGADDAPNSLANLTNVVRDQVRIRIEPTRRLLAPTDETIHEFPILFMHGRRDFQFTPEQRAALREYFERGGFLLADSICASPEFAEAMRRELRAIFPD